MKTEVKYMWCNTCKGFTPHFIQFVNYNEFDKTVSIKCSCTIHQAVILREEKRIPKGMYDEIMDDKMNPL